MLDLGVPAPTPWPVLQEAARLRELGLTDAQVATQLGICVNTIRRWRRRIRREGLTEAPGRAGSAPCPRCESGALDEASYAHLLGWYLGDGRKHHRPIVLEPWQQEIVDEHPGRLLRGLLHSDGCRVQDWAIGANGQRYEGCPRYLSINASADTIGIRCAALDRLGAAHTRPRPDTVSVARKASVALLDEHVGPES